MLNPPLPESRVLGFPVEIRPSARPSGFDLVTTGVVEAVRRVKGGWRASADDELICCLAGGIDVETLHGRRLVGPGCAILVPGRTVRRVVLREGSRLRSVLLARGAVRAAGVLPLADLLLELFDFLQANPMHPDLRRGAHEAALLLLGEAVPAEFARVAADAVRELLGAHGEADVDRWVRTAGPPGLSSEAGILEWESSLRLLEAVRLLDAGRRVGQVAGLLRWPSISACVADFRSGLGREPGAVWESCAHGLPARAPSRP